MLIYRILISTVIVATLFSCSKPENKEKPNIILVVTDDQGYGDLSCHGNPWLNTPNIDKLHDEGVRLTDFHVSPTCSPTRGALLTGLYTNKAGSWHTVCGRSMVFDFNSMLPEVLSNNGYKTGMFGKWHLGDNHPFRPQDNGFQEVLYHGGGGVGQQPDYYKNDYFNDTYFRNGEPEKHKGYCTDVFFNAAFDYINEKAEKDEPFFCYISTNAPHGPFYVEDRYAAKYKDNKDIVSPEFYGMIDNLDENMGKLYQIMDRNKITDNTIIIFMTDNGGTGGLSVDRKTQQVKRGYNAGMRGQKGSMYEGGHRVPFFIQWPKGGIQGGFDVDELTAHIDLFPTLVELLDLQKTEKLELDGVSLVDLLKGTSKELKKRTIITDSQRLEECKKWRSSSTMQGKWRLINGKALYNIETDPSQKTDVADKYPKLVEELRADYDSWWNDISKVFDKYQMITLCHETEPVTILHAMDVHLDDGYLSVWKQEHERELMVSKGWYAVNAPETGKYRFTLLRYAPESGLGLNASAAAAEEEPGTNVIPYKKGVVANIVKGYLDLDGTEISKTANTTDMGIVFELNLKDGFHKLRTEFENETGERFTAMHVKVEKL